MLRSLARAIVHRYPSAWRERYEAEVLDLIDSSPMRVSDVGELIRGLIAESTVAWADSDQPATMTRRIGMVRIAVSLGLVVAAQLVGLVLAEVFPLNASGREAVNLVVGISMLVLTTLFVFGRKHSEATPLFSELPPGLALTLLLPTFLTAVLMFWSSFGVYSSAIFPEARWWLGIVLRYHIVLLGLSHVLGGIWPPQRLILALWASEAAEAEVAHARSWVEGCLTMNAHGVASPLAAAEANLALKLSRCEEAAQALERFRYRRRFSA